MGLDKFIAKKEEFMFPICNKCRHKLPGGKCKAFNEIPAAILEGGSHDKVLPGQTGDYVFEAK